MQKVISNSGEMRTFLGYATGLSSTRKEKDLKEVRLEWDDDDGDGDGDGENSTRLGGCAFRGPRAESVAG